MTSALYVQTRKEVRALLPWWLGVMLATVAMSYVAVRNSGFPHFRYEQQVWAVAVYAAGVLALAALSLGQELTHRTFASLLVQPVERRRVLWTKISVLMAMVGVLGVVGELTLPHFSLASLAPARPLLIWAPVAIGIGLVPLFTLLTRKTLAGPVFGVVMPGLIYLIAERYYPADSLGAVTVTWYGTLVISAVGYLALSFLFSRAEVAGDGLASSSNRATPTETPGPLVRARVSATRRHWAWLSVVKELRLQQLTFAVSGLFLLLGAVIVIAQRMDPPYAGPGIGALALFHGIFIALIAGSRASAEERHLGVLAEQTLLPRAAWQQWFLKVSVTVSLALVLAVALPWLFRLVDADRVVTRTLTGISIVAPAGDWFGIESEYFVGVAFACLAALYVSSLSSNSLWALLACLPTAGVVMAIMVALDPIVFSLRRAIWQNAYATLSFGSFGAAWATVPSERRRAFWNDMRYFENVQDYLMIVLVASFSCFVLYLAHRNHRTLERGTRRIAIQAGMMSALLAVGTAAYFGASHLALIVTPLWAQTASVGGQTRDAQTTTPAGSASVSGVVQISIDRQPSPVRRARVILRNEGGAILSTDTDTQGQFRFTQLSGGTYRVIVDKPGFVPLGREPIVDLKDGQTAKVTAVMQRGAAIEGRLVNASGEPAMGLTVSAIRLGFGPYGKKVVALRQTTTDDLGRFRLHTLLPGEYYIEAAPDPLRMLGSSPVPGQIPARRTYYPGTARLNEAQVVTIAAEQQLDNVTFPMTDAALTLVTATVTTASGQPPNVFSVRVQRVGAPPGEVRCILLPSRPGAFQCPNVPPGDFWFLVAARAAPDAGIEFAAVRTTIEGRDQDLAVTTAPGASITGRVEVEGGVPLPPNVQIAALETEFELPGPTPAASTSGTPPVTVGPDGTFNFASVIGRRLFRFSRLPDGWAVKNVWLETVDIVDAPTAFNPAERAVLRVIVTPRTGSVEGNVLGNDAKPAAGARVVVFSDDARHWGARSRFVRSVEVSAAGRYAVAGLLPGQYHVAFVDLLDDGAWEDPDVLGRLRTLATPIVITGTERATLDWRMR